MPVLLPATPEQIAADVDLAWDYVHGGALDRALSFLRERELAAPAIPDYPFTRGALCYEHDRHTEALDAFSRAIDLGATGEAGLWSRLYAADIYLMRHRTQQAERLLTEALRLPGTPRSLLFSANVRQRIRIRQELSEVNEIGRFTYYLPPYLIPPQERVGFYNKLEAQWDQALEFLGLDPSQVETPSVYLYPTNRLYAAYFPPGVDLSAQAYAHREVHLVYPDHQDVLPNLAPYALYTLQRTINRTGAPFYLVPLSLDEAIRGRTADGLALGSYLRSVRDTGRLPAVESLLDGRNVDRIPAPLAQAMGALLLRMLKVRFTRADFQFVLTQPLFLGALPRPVSSYQSEFDAFLTAESDLLEDPVPIMEAVEALPDFFPVPLVDPALRGDLLEASRLYEEGQREEARAIVERLLLREPRFGEARFLRARDLDARRQFAEARTEFELTLRDTAPGSAAAAISHFHLGRLCKLQQDYPASLWHYEAAVASGLPPPRREEALEYAASLRLWLELDPGASSPGPSPAPFFAALDDALNGGLSIGTPAIFAPAADWDRLNLLAQWYQPEGGVPGERWRHRLLHFAQRNPGVTAAETLVERLDRNGLPVPGFKPERRRFLLLNTPYGAQILNFADESTLFRLSVRVSGPQV